MHNIGVDICKSDLPSRDKDGSAYEVSHRDLWEFWGFPWNSELTTNDVDRRRRAVMLVFHIDQLVNYQPETQAWGASYCKLVNTANDEEVWRIGMAKRRQIPCPHA